MNDPAPFDPLLSALFALHISKHRALLALRPPYLPHPIRRLA